MKRLIIIIIYLQANFLFSQISLNKISTYRTGIFDNGAAEIVDYDSIGRKLFFTNSSNNSVGILDISNTALPFLTQTISLVPYGNGVNSLSIHDTIVAIAVEGTTPQDTGKIVFLALTETT
jgi:hypothetical protein